MKKRFAAVLAAMFCMTSWVMPVAAQEKDQPFTPEGFSGFEEQITRAWAYDYTKQQATVVALEGGFSFLAPHDESFGLERRKEYGIESYVPGISYLAALNPDLLAGGDLGKELSGFSGLDILLADDTKYTYTFFEKGITVAKALPGKSANAPTAYIVDQEAYVTLLASLQQADKENGQYPIWLCNMRRSNVSGIKLDIRGNKASFTAGKGRFMPVFDAMKWFAVKEQVPTVIQKPVIPKTGNLITITFKKGVKITLVVTDKTLTIYASNMSYALRYQHAEIAPLSSLEILADGGRIPPNTAKPVVYLYPEQPTDVSVALALSGRLGETIPVYQNGWRVTAYPDGKLVNNADGKEYPYLFWDGWLHADWDFTRGFCVAGGETRAFLQEKLAEQGLSSTEAKEFIDYWEPQLRQNPYNLITFSTKEYEAAALLLINPQPDSVLRVHMVYRPLKQPVMIAPQAFLPFERKGFTVVEWGGTVA